MIFTDSAFHDDLATMGAAVFFPSGETLVYDGEIAASTVKAWQSLAGKQIISQAELAALLFNILWRADSLVREFFISSTMRQPVFLQSKELAPARQ